MQVREKWKLVPDDVFLLMGWATPCLTKGEQTGFDFR